MLEVFQASGTLAAIIPINKTAAVNQSPSGASHEMKKKEISRRKTLHVIRSAEILTKIIYNRNKNS